MSPQTHFCRDQHTFVTTKIILVAAAPANDRGQFHENSISFHEAVWLVKLVILSSSFLFCLFLFLCFVSLFVLFLSLFFDGGGFGE